jgi:hypothetical protein
MEGRALSSSSQVRVTLSRSYVGVSNYKPSIALNVRTFLD